MLANEGRNHHEIARELDISHQTARRWRKRWLEGQGSGLEVAARLEDVERSGAPAKFELEQILHLFKLACDDPGNYNRPLRIVDQPRVGRRTEAARDCRDYIAPSCRTITGRSRTQTSPVWLLAQSPPDPDFDPKVKDICPTYLRAQERAMAGERTISLDEMSGIQALERKAADLPMRPGKIRRHEFEYIRHGTQTLIASFDVTRGQVIQASVGDRRTEVDYLLHVQKMIAQDPRATKWHAYHGLP